MLSIIVIAHNEEKKIEGLINQISSLPIDKEIIVVNDCSGDRTAEILRSFSLNNLKVVHHASTRGKAAAVRTGIENATGEFIFIQDANLKYVLNDCHKLLEVIKSPEVDLILGSRFAKKSLGNYFLSILFGINLNDWFSHCQLIRRESLIKLVKEIRNVNDPFEILTKALSKKMHVVEVLIDLKKE